MLIAGLPPAAAKPTLTHPLSPRPPALQLEWTGDLHAVFVHAVEGLAVDAQVPSRILERMGGWGEGLTRANIASHLQKYRNRWAGGGGRVGGG